MSLEPVKFDDYKIGDSAKFTKKDGKLKIIIAETIVKNRMMKL